MKLFVLLVALLALAPLALASQREMRSYSSAMEYVDRVDVDLSAQNLPVASKEAAATSMVETQAAQSSQVQAGQQTEQQGMRFLMEHEVPEGAMDAWAANEGSDSFVETSAAAAEAEMNTDVVRALALELHDAAHAALDAGESGDLALLEADSDDADDAKPAAATATVAPAAAAAAAPAKADSDGLSPAERAQAAADRAADAADAAAEAKDSAEEKKDSAEEKKDSVERAADKVELAQIKQIEAQTAEPVREKTIIQLPSAGALSAEHARTLEVNAAASESVRGALGELGAILGAKDDTIRSLVYNVTWSAVQMGKMADVIDAQRAAIRTLTRKLHLSQAKVSQMHAHVAQSASATSAIRAQLQSVETRLREQDRSTEQLSDFIQRASKADRHAGPVPDVDLEEPIVLRPANEVRQRFARRLARSRVSMPRRYVTPAFPHMRVPPPAPFVEVPTVVVPTIAPDVPVAAPPADAVFASGYYSPSAAASYGRIPTIIVEAPDNLQ